ncbi:MAG: N-acetylmuramoyl-L-alanine amidase [Paracoccus sp. (in: a-proteobacteria)]|nr:N-acetylmuramoyl-L-alanine amidase [Paracoccus sp. (in: a-proteobacteria)]
MTNSHILSIQTALRGLNYDPGRPDGIFGARTRVATEAWLKAGGRPAVTIQPSDAGMLYQGAARHPVEEIVVHCAATRPLWMAAVPLAAKLAEIRRWHMQERGWSDIGYHYVIDRDGEHVPGRPINRIGAHVVGRNQGTIGICLLGGYEAAASDRFQDHYTPAQDAALRALIGDISRRTRIKRISGHNDHAATACPGFDVGKWLASAA